MNMTPTSIPISFSFWFSDTPIFHSSFVVLFFWLSSVVFWFVCWQASSQKKFIWCNPVFISICSFLLYFGIGPNWDRCFRLWSGFADWWRGFGRLTLEFNFRYLRRNWGYCWTWMEGKCFWAVFSCLLNFFVPIVVDSGCLGCQIHRSLSKLLRSWPHKMVSVPPDSPLLLPTPSSKAGFFDNFSTSYLSSSLANQI